MGGKSSSSSSTETSTENVTSTASATGSAGDVVQGQTITINQDLPDEAVNVFKQLVDAQNNAIGLAEKAGALAATTLARANDILAGVVRDSQIGGERSQNLVATTSARALDVVTNLTKNLSEFVAESGKQTATDIKDFASQAATPDVNLYTQNQKIIGYIIGTAALVGVVWAWRRK